MHIGLLFWTWNQNKSHKIEWFPLKFLLMNCHGEGSTSLENYTVGYSKSIEIVNIAIKMAGACMITIMCSMFLLRGFVYKDND